MANTVTDLKFTDVVDNTNGTGYFNEIMTSVKGHINTEYQAGRIVGADYATVFLGSMQYALNNAIQYVLQERVQNQQAELLSAQADNAIAETSLLGSNKALVDAKTTTETIQLNVLNAQTKVYKAQAASFIAKHNRELAQLTSDMWTVQVGLANEVAPGATTVASSADLSIVTRLNAAAWSTAESTMDQL